MTTWKTHAAPIAYLKNSKTVYIASSYSYKDRVHHLDASNPQIDNYIMFGSAQVIHDGYDYTRQDKIYNICHFAKKHNIPMFIHVCWKQFDNLQNCSTCEKCLRTCMGILAEGFNPNDFGFKYEKESSQLVKQMLSTKELPVSMEMWEQILYRFKMNAGIIEQYPDLKWILSFDFNKRKLKKHKPKCNHKTYNLFGIKIKLRCK